MFSNKKCFFFHLYIASVKISVTNNKEMGGKGGPQEGPILTFFNVYFHYLFIYLSNT